MSSHTLDIPKPEVEGWTQLSKIKNFMEELKLKLKLTLQSSNLDLTKFIQGFSFS